MTAASNYLENEVLDHILGKGTRDYTSPTTLAVALYSVAPDDTGGGTELSGSGYARTAVSFNAASSGSATNNGAVTFPTCTGDWDTVVAVGVFDATTGGNLLFYGNLTTSRTPLSGDTFQINDTALSISLD